MFEPLITKAAHKLGIDEVEIRTINAPVTGSPFGPPDAKGQRNFLTGAFMREALAKGAAEFNWEERKKRNGQKTGTKVTGVAVALGEFTAGTIGFDGLLTIEPNRHTPSVHATVPAYMRSACAASRATASALLPR
mgnify:CR=1 FL=1